MHEGDYDSYIYFQSCHSCRDQLAICLLSYGLAYTDREVILSWDSSHASIWNKAYATINTFLSCTSSPLTAERGFERSTSATGSQPPEAGQLKWSLGCRHGSGYRGMLIEY